MQRLKALAGFLFIFFLFTPTQVEAWSEKITHPDLSEQAARKSVLGVGDYLKNIGFSKGLDERVDGKEVFKWIRDGAEFEDKSDPLFPVFGTTRSVNHFHNPLKPWTEAGLDDWVAILHYTGESSLLWAQDGARQRTYLEGDWSWQKIRDYYYLALTSTTNFQRQPNFARTFRGLGHQMHLIQDGAEPDHVRNDAHPEDTMGLTYGIGIEKWAGNNVSFVNSLASNPLFAQVPFDVSYSHLAPITQLLDTLQYINGANPSTSLVQGISEYTNANFFSDDTMFAAERYPTDHRHYFPYPKKSSTDLDDYLAWNKLPQTVMGEDNIPDTAFWIKKIADGETIEHFLKPTYLTNSIGSSIGFGPLYYRSFFRDEKCHEDYARHLIPRAVGYSAGLLDYFFRGNLYVAFLAPSVDQVNYNFGNENDMGRDIGTVAMFIQNSSKLNNLIEPIGQGTISLTVSYVDSTTGKTVYRPAGIGSVTGIPDVGTETFLSVLFTLAEPIRTQFAKELTYYLVFRGRLGKEEDAVIGKALKAPMVHGISPDQGVEGTLVTITGDYLPEIDGPFPTTSRNVNFSRDPSQPYTAEVINRTDTEITSKVPNTAAIKKPGYGGLRVRRIVPGTEEMIYSNPVSFFPIAEGQIRNLGGTLINAEIEAVEPILGDYSQLPPSVIYPVLPGNSVRIELMTGFTYKATANTSVTQDIWTITPDPVDFIFDLQ